MTAFGWKRKIGQISSNQALGAFSESNQSEDAEIDSDFDWILEAKKKKFAALEDNQIKFNRLKAEGIALAGGEKYWQAIGRWDEALSLDPTDAAVHEMKAQSLIQLHEWIPAIQAASRAIEYKKTWWEGFQTLGRAQLGLGEIKLARRSFQIALHLNPADEELRKNDLRWVVKLHKKYHELQTTEDTEGTQTGKLFTDKDSSSDESDSESDSDSEHLENEHYPTVNTTATDSVKMRI